jgi:hypothetical protein
MWIVVITIKCVCIKVKCVCMKNILDYIIFIVLYCILTNSDSSGSVRDSSNLGI